LNVFFSLFRETAHSHAKELEVALTMKQNATEEMENLKHQLKTK
jgi:hypothetical protein